MPYQMQSPPGARVLINGRWRDYFAGCSYLGLQGHPALIAAATAALQTYGLGTATSRGGYGEHPLFEAVERAAARAFAAPHALYFASGYLGNGVLLQSLRDRYDMIFVDDAAHFSVRDGARLVGVPVVSFHHLDPDDLAARCRQHLPPGGRPLVLSDGVFPVSGEIAPVPAYLRALADFPGALLCLDDAHATAVLGDHGRGTLEYWGVTAADCYASHTASKALGSYGGFIVGDATLVEQVRRHAGAWVGASPPPLPAAAATAQAIELAMDDDTLRQRLWANVARARAGLRALGWPLADTPVPILCLGARRQLNAGWGPPEDLASIKEELFARDICVAHVTSYTSTPAGGALRIAIFATHSEEQIDRLIAEIGRLVE